MSWLDRFRRRRESYLGIDATAAIDLEPIVTGLLRRLHDQQPVITRIGEMALVRSPVLVMRDDRLVQPVAVIPIDMLSRFWSDDARAVWDHPGLPPFVADAAKALSASDDLSRLALADTERLWVTEGAAAEVWPDRDRRLRLVSLVLADAVRKLAAGLTTDQVMQTYGDSRITTDVRTRVQAMSDRDAAAIASSRKPFS